jgi:hypothetical protein
MGIFEIMGDAVRNGLVKDGILFGDVIIMRGLKRLFWYALGYVKFGYVVVWVIGRAKLLEWIEARARFVEQMEASPSNALKIISLLDSVREPEAEKMLTPHTPASYVGAASCCKLEESAGDDFSDSAVAPRLNQSIWWMSLLMETITKQMETITDELLATMDRQRLLGIRRVCWLTMSVRLCWMRILLRLVAVSLRKDGPVQGSWSSLEIRFLNSIPVST